MMMSPVFAQDTEAQPTGLYLAAGAGLNQPSDADSRVRTSPGITDVVEFGTGYNLVGAVGYKWTSGLRTELEFDYRRAQTDRVNGVDGHGAQKAYSFSGNVLYDFDLNGPLSPYVGAGLGVARNRWSNVNAGFNSANFNGGDTRLQWQLIGGVSMQVSRPLALFVDYRYIGVNNANYHDSFSNIVDAHSNRSHNVIAGVRFFL